MKTKIKICGLTRPQDVEAVNAARPDYIGFVFAKSRRRLTPQQAITLKRQLDPEIQSVGVFVNPSLETVLDITSRDILDIVQLHGDEPPAFAERVRRETGCPVVKAFRIRGKKAWRRSKLITRRITCCWTPIIRTPTAAPAGLSTGRC